MLRTVLSTIAVAVLAVQPAWQAQALARATPKPTPAEQQVVELARQLIAVRSVDGPGNQIDKAYAIVRQALVAGGWSDKEIETVPFENTAYMIATWPGSDPALKPLVVSGHMDVVEADPRDWTRNPFTPVIEDGVLYGRGASDMKFDAALATASLIELRRRGFKPRRTVILQFSGDEETTMKTSRVIAERLKDAELVINIDGAGGVFDETTGKPLYWTWQGAEKAYVDYQLEVTDPGGHSSTPRADNAIARMAAAVARVAGYRFQPERNAITRAYFEKAARFESDPAIARAMRAFATDPADEAAIAVLRGNPATVGKIGTTCVPTMIAGGHAQNALPQRVTVNVNCRIFPGHGREDIRAELERVVADPAVKVTDVSGENTTTSPASPMRPDLLAALERAMARAWPGVPIIPSQASGASDSMWYRVLGVPSYSASPVFTKDSEEFSHGLNERIRLSNIKPGIAYYLSLFADLAR